MYIITSASRFPDPSFADADGLLCCSKHLTIPLLREAYQKGIFPWYHENDPVLWYSPDPRFVLFPDKLHISHSLQSRLRKPDYRITHNQQFSAVIEACRMQNRPGQDGTWIHPEMVSAYKALYADGRAHSFECWIDQELAGGLYGVWTGKVFSGESMFSRRSNAGKLAFVHAVKHLQSHGVTLIDCQVYTENLERYGAEYIARSQFLQYLR